jgi:hypothetical protein
MRLLVISLAVSTLLIACSGGESIRDKYLRETAEKAQQKCSDFGYITGSADYNQCVDTQINQTKNNAEIRRIRTEQRNAKIRKDFGLD